MGEQAGIFLKDLDYRTMSSWRHDWKSLDKIDKLYCLMSLCHLGERKLAGSLLDKYESELRDLKIFNTIQLRLSLDSDKSFANSLIPSLTEDLAAHDSPLLKAEIQYNTGYAFLCSQNYELAEAFYIKSAKYYDESGCRVMTWYSENNRNICRLYLGKSKDYMKNLEKIYRAYKHFPLGVKPRLALILIWQLLYAGKPRRALEIIEENINRLEKVNCKVTRGLLRKYANYLEGIEQGKVSIHHIPDSDLEEHQFIWRSHLYSKTKIISKILKWEHENYYVDRFHFVDLLFENLLRKDKIELLLKVFKWFEDEILHQWRFVIPPRNIYHTACLASKILKRKSLCQDYVVKFKMLGPESSYTLLEAELKRIEEKQRSKTICVNLVDREITVFGKRKSLKKRHKAILLLDILAETQSKISLENLSRKIYSDIDSDHNIPRVSMLVSRTLKSLGIENCVYVSRGEIVISSKYTWKKVSNRKMEKKQRIDSICSMFKSRNIKLTSQMISKELGVTSRTITSDLADLTRKGLIRRLNGSRSTVYVLSPNNI